MTSLMCALQQMLRACFCEDGNVRAERDISNVFHSYESAGFDCLGIEDTLLNFSSLLKVQKSF